MKNTTNTATTRKLLNGISGGFSGLTSDYVHVAVVERTPKKTPSREEVLTGLPVSTEVCARFVQKAGIVERVVHKVKQQNPSMEFHVEAEPFCTNVWRVA